MLFDVKIKALFSNKYNFNLTFSYFLVIQCLIFYSTFFTHDLFSKAIFKKLLDKNIEIFMDKVLI